MKIDENVQTAKQSPLIQKGRKEETAKLAENNTKASVERKDIVTLDNTVELPKEMISRGNALDALAKVIREMNQMPEATLNSLHQPIDREKVSTLLQT